MGGGGVRLGWGGVRAAAAWPHVSRVVQGFLAKHRVAKPVALPVAPAPVFPGDVGGLVLYGAQSGVQLYLGSSGPQGLPVTRRRRARLLLPGGLSSAARGTSVDHNVFTHGAFPGGAAGLVVQGELLSHLLLQGEALGRPRGQRAPRGEGPGSVVGRRGLGPLPQFIGQGQVGLGASVWMEELTLDPIGALPP